MEPPPWPAVSTTQGHYWLYCNSRELRVLSSPNHQLEILWEACQCNLTLDSMFGHKTNKKIWVWCINGRMLSTQSLVKTWLYLLCTADFCQDSPKCSDQIPLTDTNSTFYYILDRCALSWRKHAPTIHLMVTNVTLYNSLELTGKIHILLYATHSFAWICTIQAIFCKFFFKLFSKHYKENKS